MTMLTCRELTEFLLAYLDGELPEAQRREFERHLEACPACVHYTETYRETVRLGKQCCASDALPADVPEALVRAILAARRR
jgi:anti-sigma factor (TIGR02949 family)